jgi:hypothetical protein
MVMTADRRSAEPRQAWRLAAPVADQRSAGFKMTDPAIHDGNISVNLR